MSNQTESRTTPVVPITNTADVGANAIVQDSETPSSNRYVCLTQPKSKRKAIQVGQGGTKPEIARWVPGSVLKYATPSNAYPDSGKADLALSLFAEAIKLWNEVGVVKFQRADREVDANIILRYAGPPPTDGTRARGFFPDAKKTNYIELYSFAFDPSQVGILKWVFLHELGHVLGLRHEFANDIDPQDNTVFEGGSVTVGARNSLSIMSYEPNRDFQQSDKDGTKTFYGYKNEALINNVKVHDYTPGK